MKPDDFPQVIRIETSGVCNFQCIHCPVNNQRGILNRFDEIINQFKTVPRVVVLYHGGEPLLNKNIPEYISRLKQIGVTKVQIVTNGSLLTSELSERLITAGLDEIHFSFDGQTARENNTIRKGGDFLIDAGNVKEFYMKKGSKDIRILISNVQFNQDPTVPEYLTEYFSGCPEIEFQSVPAIAWPGLNGESKTTELNPDYCSHLFETITILSNGDIVPCCYDLLGKVIFGNVFLNNIYDIWDDYQYFRTDFRKRIYSDLCEKCQLVSLRYKLS